MNDNSQNKIEKNESEQAGANTAHVAGKTAATYFGGTLGNIAYNKISQTKAGQKIETAAGKAISSVPFLNKINKGLNDSGAIDTADKAVDAVGGGLGKNSGKARPLGRSGSRRPTGNMASKNKLNSLNKSVSNNETEKPKALQNKNHVQRLWNQINQRGINNETHEETEDSDDLEENNDDKIQERKSLFKSKGIGGLNLKTKIILTIVVAFLAFILIFTLLVSIISPISSIVSIFSLDSWKKEDKQYVYEDGEKRKSNEDYNNYILGSSDGSVKGIVPYFKEKYGVTIDWVMLDTVVQYRFMLSSEKELYSDVKDDISEEELNKKLEELEESLNSDSDSEDDSSGDINFGANYNIPKDIIRYVAYLMMDFNDFTFSEGYKYVACDLEVGGSFYNKLIDSWFLKIYYKDFLIDDEYETRKKLVDEIFEQYKFAKEAIRPNGLYGIISDNMQMYLQTCKFPPYSTTQNERGKTVFTNDRNINAGTNYPEYFSLTDYLKGAVEGELGRDSLNDAEREGVKAFTIATLTYMLGSFYVDFYPGVQSINYPSGNCRLVSCDVNNGCTYTNNGNRFGTAYSGLNRFGVTTGIHRPWSEEEKSYMDDILAEVFGIVMVTPGVTPETFTSGDQLTGGSYYSDMSYCGDDCMGQEEALEDSRNGMTYEEILHKYYTNFDLINIREGLYVEYLDYDNVSYDGEIIFYDQTDYRTSFCGRDTTIAAAGCGVTSTAIIISSFTGNRQYDPVYFSNMAKSTGDCGEGISGTEVSFFKKVADKFNYGYEHVSTNNASRVIELLEQGNTMVIAHMGAGHFTDGGHYIVLAGVNDKGQVYVLDPYNKVNKAKKGTGNGWFDFNTIVKESKSGFYAIIKR